MEIRTIKSEEQYKEVLKEIEKVWTAKRDTPEGDLLDILLLLVEQYEKKYYPIESLDPIDAIKYEMEENGLSQRDMVKYFGSKERVSEVLNRKRPLTLKMIKTLYHELGIPAASLLAV